MHISHYRKVKVIEEISAYTTLALAPRKQVMREISSIPTMVNPRKAITILYRQVKLPETTPTLIYQLNKCETQERAKP